MACVRPAVRPLRLLPVLLALGAVAASVAVAPRGEAAPARQTFHAHRGLNLQLLSQVNALRARRGLKPLRAAPSLRAAAAVHSRQMAAAGFFSHSSSDGSAFWKRIERFYGSRGAELWSVGENLVWASPELTAEHAVRLWLKSPAHRKIMLDSRWREVGISAVRATAAPGVFRGQAATIVTVDFGVRHRTPDRPAR